MDSIFLGSNQLSNRARDLLRGSEKDNKHNKVELMTQYYVKAFRKNIYIA